MNENKSTDSVSQPEGVLDISKTLVSCLYNVTTSSLNHRKQVFAQLSQCVNNPGFQDGHFKGVAKILILTLPKYQDKKSRDLVLNFICEILKIRNSVAANSLLTESLNCASSLLKYQSSYMFPHIAFTILKWCSKVKEACFQNQLQEVESLSKILLNIEVVCFSLICSYCGKRNQRLKNTANAILRKYKNIDLLNKFLDMIINNDKLQVESLCYIGFLYEFFTEEKSIDKIKPESKKSIIDIFVKNCIQTKVRVNPSYIKAFAPFLKYVTHEEFKELIPVVENALLRNPEIVLGAIGLFLDGLSIDLSQYLQELSSCISTHLISKHPSLRQDAVISIQAIAKQCSDVSAIEVLIGQLMKILNGSEGKLALPEQRYAVFQAIDSVIHTTISGQTHREKIATIIYKGLFPHLLQEGHEDTLLYGLSVAANWCKYFVSELPKLFIDNIKKGISLKTSTAIVQAYYLLVANEAIKGNTISQAQDILPTLFQMVEKSKQQSHVVNNVFLSIVSSTLILKILRSDDIKGGSKADAFWVTVLDPSKRVLTHEKFLAARNTEFFFHLGQFLNHLYLHHFDRINEQQFSPWIRATNELLIHGNFKTRSSLQQTLSKLFDQDDLDLSKFLKNLLIDLHDFILSEEERLTSQGSKENEGKFPIKHVINTYKFLLKLHGNKSTDLLKESLFNIHHPWIYDVNPKFFNRLGSLLDIDLKSFVSNEEPYIMKTFEEAKSITKTYENTLRSLTEQHLGENLLQLLLNHVTAFLKQPSLVQVTQREFEIMKTPDGVAYDQSVYESAKATSDKQKNMKRESKAYSYKEQKIEMELKEELRKKKGLSDKIELNKKQKEQLQAILEQEKTIRERLQSLDIELQKNMSILKICLLTGSKHLSQCSISLIKLLTTLLNSPLAASYAVDAFLILAQQLFPGDLKYLGELIGNVTLRLMNPTTELPKGWQDEELLTQVSRAIEILILFVTERNHYILMTYTMKEPFSGAAFSYCVPLLRNVLNNQGAIVKGSEPIRLKVLHFIQSHFKPKSSLLNEEINYMPIKEILQVLSDVIVACEGHNKEGKIQQLAIIVFNDICKTTKDEHMTEETELLLNNLLSNCSALRKVSLKGLIDFPHKVPIENNAIRNLFTCRVIVSRFDMVEENANLSRRVWDEKLLSVNEDVISMLIDDVLNPLDDIRFSASEALAYALSQVSNNVDILPTLLSIYHEKLKVPPPVIDNLGRTVSQNFVDPWTARQGIGLALQKIVQYVPVEKLEELFSFFVPTSLGDRNEFVRKQMLDASLEYVNHYGQEHMEELLSIFQEFLEMAPDSSSHDTIRQSVIILTGSLAKHLAKTDPQIKPIFAKLMAALSTPSQSVQEAVANCLPPLCGAMKDEAPDLIKGLLEQLLESESYGERRGAAYGLAGIVKGLGILSLKQQNVITTLNEAIQNKKSWRHREGALFAFETLCSMLGRLFEPYVVHLLPHLLLCFGDGNQYVREAADETAKAVMKNLSNHGVKLVLPSLLKALEEDSWRTKTGSAELLGAMSFCAPKQLSSCLPNIVPRLTEVLADSHLKVQKAGQQALRQIGGVIRNPEIQEIAPIILDALSDPNTHTVTCLQALLSTSFVHFIDAPSLALIMPTLEKALAQRPTETKKMAAQILGNMYALTDPKDLSPYLPAVTPGLKKSLLDPSPEVRAVSARALGAIVKGMGEECFNDLMPWLLETLTSEISSVDRSGAAQGLAEVLMALGVERLAKLMPDVIDTTMKTDLAPNVRDGYLMLYIYLPATFEDLFMDYIGPIVPAILKGLADESEYVRDTSLKAGQRIINMYADSAIELLLPELEAGLFHDHWRIRLSSVQLLGDLLFRLSGVTGKQTTVGEEDDNFGTAHSAKVILHTLGTVRRDHVYAGLYMGRSDVALAVRQSALHVWKVIVQNTAKTLREILPTLFELLLGCLASQSYDKRQVAARTLGDLVRKLGERILPEIIPILEAGLDNEDSDKRQGVCIGLSEIMNSTSREMISQFEDSLITTIRRALVDESSDVRNAASLSFENLHNTIGHRALDGILPSVFTKLDDPNLADYALDGLKQVMAVKSKSVLPFLVPKLTTPPVNTKALAILSSVAGEALTKHIERILPAMIQAVHSSIQADGSEFEGTRTLILSVEDDVGLRTIVDELMSSAKNQNPGIRKVAARLLGVFCKETRGDYMAYVQQLFRCVMQLLNDVDDNVIIEAWSALDALVKHLDPSEQIQHLTSVRQAIRFIKDDVRNDQLPGFCIPKKGITPVLPIFRECILNGPPETKEIAANVLGDIIKLTSPEALKPSVVQITGPLIRILGDRFNSSVKIAILDTLGLLLQKVGIMLKPFLPQLQTTFVKALNDSALGVRQKAAWALGLLTVLHTRVDSLFTELKNGIRNNDDPSIRETILDALRTVTLKAGKKMGEAVRNALLETLVELISAPEDGVRVKSAAALGAFCKILPGDDIKQVMNKNILEINPMIDWVVSHGRSVALSYALYDAPSEIFNAIDDDDIIDAVVKYSNNDRVPICTYGVHSLGHLLMFSNENSEAAPSPVISSLKKNLTHSSIDVKIAALNTLKHLSKHTPEVLTFDRVRYIIPEFVSLVKDRNTTVRSFAELTLVFVLQLNRNDVIFDQCVQSITGMGSFFEDFKKTTFTKLSDSIATDRDDYIYLK